MQTWSGRNRKSILVISVLMLVLWLCVPIDASAQGSITRRLGEAVSSVVNSATGATFTITSIEGNKAERSVQVVFTDSCDMDALRRELKLIPPAPVDWYNSGFSREKNVLTIRGQFKPGQQYAVILPPTFKSANGRTYAKTVTGFAMPDLPTQISYIEQGSVIERDSRQMLHVQLRNVNEVQFQGLQVPPGLLPEVIHLSGGASANPWGTIRPHLLQRADHVTSFLMQDRDFELLAGKAIEDEQLFFSREEKNLFHQFSIPLGFRKIREKGTLELVQVMGKDLVDVQTGVKLYRITDIGLTYKLADDGLLLWATSLHSGKPVKGAVFFAFTHEREAVPIGTADDRGLLFVKNNMVRKRMSLRGADGGKLTSQPLLLTEVAQVAAVTRDDTTYIDIVSAGTVRPDGITQDRAGRSSLNLRKGHVFTERGIYRPGETVFFKGTVRAYQNGAIAPPQPSATALFRVMTSKNEEIYKKEIALSEFGTASDKFALKAFFPLGTYTLTMSFGQGREEQAVRSFEVQEFRQPRHYVEINYKRSAEKDDSYINLSMNKEVLNCEIAGKYFAGGPVKHGKVRWSIYHTRTDYPRQDHQGYTFGHPLDARTDLIESGESMLDEKGAITVPVPVGKDVLSGKYGIEVTASVVDFDGRASTDSSVYQGDPDYLVGISNHPPTVLPGEGQTLAAIVIDRKGSKVTKGDVLVQVMERSYTHIRKRNDEGLLYQEQQQVWRSQLSVELPIKDDRATFDFDFARGGEYLVTFTYRDASGREYASATRYATVGYEYDGEYVRASREDARNYGKLSLYPERPVYASGDTMRIYLNPPNEVSTFLVTVEQGGFVDYALLDLKPGQRFFELPVKDSYNPNVYVSVLGTVARSGFPVYATEFDSEAPSFVFGTVNVEVKGSQQKIRIAVNEEQKKIKSLPGAAMTLTIATTDQQGKGIMSEVALAVVDESILSMTAFETPSLDLLGKFLLPLGVFTGDLRLDLLKQTPYGLFRNAALTGGDGEEPAGPEAVSSKIRKDFNPVAYFNPSVRTDGNGKATVTFTFPDSMTTYRIYAVACDKGSRFGSYQRPALVVKDFYLEPGLPAFLTRGDRFRFAVSAFNKTDSGGTFELAATSDDLLKLALQGKPFPIGASDRTLVPIDGTVQRSGTTTFVFTGRFKDLSDTMVMKLPVNSGLVHATDTVFGTFRKFTDVTYAVPRAVKDLKPEDTGPGDVQCLLTISGSPFLRMSPGLRYFLRYPYG